MSAARSVPADSQGHRFGSALISGIEQVCASMSGSHSRKSDEPTAHCPYKLKVVKQWLAQDPNSIYEMHSEVTLAAERLVNNVFGEAQLQSASGSFNAETALHRMPTPMCLDRHCLNLNMWLGRSYMASVGNDGECPLFLSASGR